MKLQEENVILSKSSYKHVMRRQNKNVKTTLGLNENELELEVKSNMKQFTGLLDPVPELPWAYELQKKFCFRTEL